ncbi:MAG: hypothetical protein IJS59_02770 [Bacteroidaceae bacterium]|nr:hypothetical protein [Bacteroidaceae bacterium]
MDALEIAMQGGITFRKASAGNAAGEADKLRTKAKKKGYVTGAHGSASAMKKADIRRRRANRHK